MSSGTLLQPVFSARAVDAARIDGIDGLQE
jgi:hypothetical protein